MKLSFVLALDHRGREVWRYYKAIVEHYGPGSLEARRVRSNIRAMLKDYTPTSVRLDARRLVLGLA